MSCREGLEFATTVASDTAPLHGLVAAMLDTGADVHVLRDPTRGGVAATLNEIARTAKVGISLDERTFPIPAEVRDACGLLGLDPLYVANEGKLLAFVPAEDADRVLAAMRAHPLGAPCRGDRSLRHRPPGDGVGQDRARRHPRGRPADRRTAAADLLNDRSRPVRLLRVPAQRARVLRSRRHLAGRTRSLTQRSSTARGRTCRRSPTRSGVSDPLDDDVVRNYWIGGPLLDKVDPDELLTRVAGAFTGQVTGMLDDICRRECAGASQLSRLRRLPVGAVPRPRSRPRR